MDLLEGLHCLCLVGHTSCTSLSMNDAPHDSYQEYTAGCFFHQIAGEPSAHSLSPGGPLRAYMKPFPTHLRNTSFPKRLQ